MGGLGEAFNKLTAGIGVKLFPGGPYNGRDQMYDARDLYSQLAGQGVNMLGSTYLPNGGEQSLQGAMADTTGRLMSTTLNPQALSGPRMAKSNQMAGANARRRTQALSSLRQKLMARGITSPSAIAMAEQRLAQQFDAQGQAEQTDYQEQGRSKDLAELGALLSTLLGQHQYGSSLVGQGAAGKMGAGQALSAEAQQAYQNFFSALGMAAGYGSPLGGGAKSTTPWYERLPTGQVG